MVRKAGPLLTVQDLGRRAGRRQGLAPGGAMDQRAALWANRLLGNAPRAPVLEVTLGGAELEFASGGIVALTGSGCSARIGGAPAAAWRTHRVAAGDVLSFGFSGEGLRAYVAFPGGLDAPTAFGSASVVLREGLTGALGRALTDGDELAWAGGDEPGLARVPPDHVPVAQAVTDLPLIPGYEWDEFSEEDRETLLNTNWTVDPASDRIAVRLEGPALESGPESLDSTPLVDGTVQVPGDGRPLVFMRDRPTIGGYPKLGSVDRWTGWLRLAPGVRFGSFSPIRTKSWSAFASAPSSLASDGVTYPCRIAAPS
jgi:biotin-dependent carboxylase-like uncharacterized protein